MGKRAVELADSVRKKFNSGEAKLPVLPEAVIKVRAIVADETKGSEDIARVIGDDPTFSTTVLRLANSARFNTSGKEIRSLPMAVQRLGGRRTLQLLIAISGKLLMKVEDRQLQQLLRDISHHSMMVAAAAQHLASMIPGVFSDEAFVTGLLHEIGASTVICAAPEELKACGPAERIDIIQALHREMGARLLNYWGMPSIFTQVVLHHGIESDDRPREMLIDYVDAADFLVQRAGHAALLDAVSTDIDAMQFPPIMRLGIKPTHVAAIEVELEDALAELEAAFSGAA